MLLKALSPVTLRQVEFKNRLGMSPMCTYSANEGKATHWHQTHLASRAQGGLGLVFVEATAVSSGGRITLGDLGLWNEEQKAAFKPIVQAVSDFGAVPGIQLAHAGRKALCQRPWEGGKLLALDAMDKEILERENLKGDFKRVAPSPLAFSPDFPTPRELSPRDIQELVLAFGQSARRAREAGFKLLEIHGAHGYLIHSFLSPISNQRQDSYGGSPSKRFHFLGQIIEECRLHWGEDYPLGVRLSMVDWAEKGKGLSLEDSVEYGRMLRSMGVDFIDCSSGGNLPQAAIPVAAGYQVPFARAIKEEAGISSMAVGLIESLSHANEVVSSGAADFVLLGRALLRDPFWLFHELVQTKELAASMHLQDKVGIDAKVYGELIDEIARVFWDILPYQYRRGYGESLFTKPMEDYKEQNSKYIAATLERQRTP